MSLSSPPAGTAERHARRAVRESSPWVQRLARLGYAAKGVVYVIIGGIAAQAAFTPAEDLQDSDEALGTILRQPFGRVLLAVVALGLAGYVLWRLVQALLDPEHKGTDAKGLATRAGYLISAAAYAGLTLEAVRLLRGNGGGGEGSGAQHWTAIVMDQPFGRVLVGLAGAGIAAFGLYEIYRGFTANLGKRLDLEGDAVPHRKRIVAVGRVGHAARGVVFGIIGWLVFTAARQYDASEAQGLEGALAKLREQPYGAWLLGIVAMGLVAYGLFQLVNARYRAIRPNA